MKWPKKKTETPEVKTKELPAGLRLLKLDDVIHYDKKNSEIHDVYCAELKKNILETTKPLADAIIAKAKAADENLEGFLTTETLWHFGIHRLHVPLVNTVVAIGIAHFLYPDESNVLMHSVTLNIEGNPKNSKKELEVNHFCLKMVEIFGDYLHMDFTGIAGENDLNIPYNCIVINVKLRTGLPFPS